MDATSVPEREEEEGEFVKDFWHGSLNTGVVLGDSCRILLHTGAQEQEVVTPPGGEAAGSGSLYGTVLIIGHSRLEIRTLHVK